MLHFLQNRRSQPQQHKRQATAFCATVALFAIALISATSAIQPASGMVKMTPSKAPMKPAQLSQCTGCHGADLAGRQGFSPSIHVHGGALHDYTKAQFAALLLKGVKNDGTMLKRMPVFKYPAPISNKLFAYLTATT